MTLPSSVRLAEEPAGYPVVIIDHPSAHGRIALNGAHVMEWTPAGAEPVLYMSPDAMLETGKAIRGGVPVCWPWFGPHPEDASKAAHGFVRNLPWTVSSVEESADGVTLEFHLSDSAETHLVWPHSFDLALRVIMGAQLSLELSIKNTGSTPWSMTGALHTYLCVADIRETAVIGLDDSYYVESRLSPDRVEQSGPVYFNQEVDRNYQSRGTVRVLDRKGKRTLVVEKSGSRSTIVWNPWIEKSKRLADLPDEAYFGFLCIEAANAAPDIVSLEAGEEHVLSQKITVQPD